VVNDREVHGTISDTTGDITEGTADDSGGGAGRIVLLTTSHRVAPGLLSWQAWDVLRGADAVLCADAAHPQLPYLKEAGVEVTLAAGPLAARDLVDRCADGGRTVAVLTTAEGDRRLTDGLASLAGSGRERMPSLELLPGSYDLPGARLLDLVQVMDRIRRECPWSSRRTHEDLAKYALEEAYELVEAIETGDRAELREELGDVLLQVVFHARIGEEATGEASGDAEEADDAEDGVDTAPFSIDDVAGGIVTKLIHRHPHVFGDSTATTPEEVKEHWQRTKAVEKQRASVTDGVPVGQPGLALAAKLGSRVRTAGLDVPVPTGSGLGHELLTLALSAEAAGLDPEAELRAAARAYRSAIRATEGLAE
jgi:XTP/dITP diphosphohydrolase